MKLRNLNINDIDNILDLQKTIFNNLIDKKHFATNNKSFFEKSLNNKKDNLFLGLFDGNNLIAYTLIILNVDDYKKIIKDSEINFDKKSANYDIVVVHPDYRGQNIHKKFINFAEKVLIEDNFKEIYCTVHPDNLYSLNNFFDYGYKRLLTFDKKKDFVRFFLKKELKA